MGHIFNNHKKIVHIAQNSLFEDFNTQYTVLFNLASILFKLIITF